MKILIDTSTLVSGSISWKYYFRGKNRELQERTHPVCKELLSKIKDKGMESNTIITKTVEDETRGVLRKAVVNAIKDYAPKGIEKKYKIMVLQELILNNSLDNLDYYIEECSIRLPIDKKLRDEIKDKEIEPFIKKIIIKTYRYLRPPKIPKVPRRIGGPSFQRELKNIMFKKIPSSGVIYKGMPEDRDLIIMAEATFLHRTKFEDEDFYIVSLDNHFKPNPVYINSYLSGNQVFTGKLDSTIRDKIHTEFGFIGEYPTVVIQVLDGL